MAASPPMLSAIAISIAGFDWQALRARGTWRFPTIDGLARSQRVSWTGSFRLARNENGSMSNQRRRSQQRLARFEQFEKRLMMTADPVASAAPLDLGLYREPMTVEVAAEFVAPIAPSEFPACLLYTSPSPRDKRQSRMPSSA